MAIPGIYFFDKNVVNNCKYLDKSKRNELEIVDLLKIYIKENTAKYTEIGRGISWLDMGSFDDLNDCSNYIRAIEKRQNFVTVKTGRERVIVGDSPEIVIDGRLTDYRD